MTQSQPESNPPHLIEIEDEDYNNVNVDVGLSIPMIRNTPLGSTPYLPQLQQMGVSFH